jgi:anthranilate synthase/phosphoribosyltransferase
MNPSRIILSPGPGRPEDAGVSVDVVKAFAGQIPMLGVCLGHQAIGYAYGATVTGAKRIVHGKVEEMDLDGRGLFRSIDSPAQYTRYHSLVVDGQTLPAEIEVTARAGDGEVMGLRHTSYTLEGVQFHPESIASETGKKLLRNFLHYRREPFIVKSVLNQLLDGTHLSQEEAENFMEELTEGNLTDAQIGAFLVALNAKGIQPEEIAGCAVVLQRKRVQIRSRKPVLDTCGTGGDGLGTFNISSLAGLVAAAAGATLAKHGNRAVSSKSGSADFYRELGMELQLTPDHATRVLDEEGFVFLFAPLYHQAMKYAAKPRKELGVKTIMNLLGPLVNPAAAEHQVIGVFDRAFSEPVARAARLLGIKRAMIVHGDDGLDEISVSGPTHAIWFDESGRFEEMVIRPEEYGIETHPLGELAGGDAAHNAEIARELLAGGGPAAIRDAVILNAGAGLLAYGLVSELAGGVSLARETLESGAAQRKLEAVVRATTTQPEESAAS